MTHAVEIGSTTDGDETRLFESSQNVRIKLEEIYLPAVIADWRSQRDPADGASGTWQPRIDVQVPETTNIVTLSAEAPRDRLPAYKNLMEATAARLEEDHRRFAATIRSRLEAQITKARNNLGSTRDRLVKAQNDLQAIKDNIAEERNALEKMRDDVEQARNNLQGLRDDLTARREMLKRLDTRAALLKEEIEKLQASIADAESSRNSANGGPVSPTEAMTVMLVSNEIRHARQRITALRQRLQVELPNERLDLRNKIARIERRIEEQQAKIQRLETGRIEEQEAKIRRLETGRIEEQKAEIERLEKRVTENQEADIRVLESRLANLNETRALSAPRRSIQPVNTSAVIHAQLGVLLGAFAGLLAAFFAEFVARARAERRN